MNDKTKIPGFALPGEHFDAEPDSGDRLPNIEIKLDKKKPINIL